jgi:hypothetical protein
MELQIPESDLMCISNSVLSYCNPYFFMYSYKEWDISVCVVCVFEALT